MTLVRPENYNFADRLLKSMDKPLDRFHPRVHTVILLLLLPVVLILALVSLTLHVTNLLAVEIQVVPTPRRRLGPPPSAEFLFYLFMTPQNCDALAGDLEERYRLIHKKFGRRHADFWYWTQAVRSLGPIVWAWAKRVSLKPVVGVAGWALAKGLIGHNGWLAAVLEAYRKVRP